MPAPNVAKDTDRLAALEARVTALEAGSAAAPAAGSPAAPSGPVTYTSGVGTPDARGRVQLEEVERKRAEWTQLLQGKNAELPKYFYLQQTTDLYPNLDESQKSHILMNTGQNASDGPQGRKGVAYDVAQTDGKWATGDHQADAWGLQAKTAAEAVTEIEKKVRDLASGTASGTEFSPPAKP